MANIIESRVTLEDEVFEETIDTMEEPIEVVRPSSYEDLEDLPQVNGVTLMGNKTSEELGIVTATDIENAVSAEATLRENADTALGGRIDGEKTARENADTALGGRIDGEITNRTNADNALGTRIDNEILARQGGDNNLQTQIDAITSKSDVVDVVADYAALQAYDTQHLGNNDVIKVLDDETHDDAQTYYRWNKTAGTWSYIGSEAPYYSKGQMDTMLQAKQDKLIAGTNIQIAQDGKTISATDTTYTAGNGLNLTGTEFSADTTVLATKTDIAPKLQTEVVAELPATGDESKLYLTPKDYTTGTASGNPITISLGEDAGQITSAQLDGDTYQQTYTGKNLFNPSATPWAENVAYNNTGQQNWAGYYGIDEYQPVEASTQYTFSNDLNKPIHYGIAYYNSSKSLISATIADTTTFTTPANCAYIRFAIESSTAPTWTQLELGSTATTYEPFCGGVPSPNPDYPQQIQTVTGVQTISINGTDYSIDLGSIELCKLSTYQDYIYKDGDDWKIKKQLEKVRINSLSWFLQSIGGSSNHRIATTDLVDTIVVPPSNNDAPIIACDYYVPKTAVETNARVQGISIQTLGSFVLRGWVLIYDNNYHSSTSLDAWKNSDAYKLGSFYYALDTATDTTITDQTLIAQLEAVRNATLQASNTITNTATGTNLAGDLELGYYEYDPQNRYDKWLWLDLNNSYEKLGS